jgi:hypothetical protein
VNLEDLYATQGFVDRRVRCASPPDEEAGPSLPPIVTSWRGRLFIQDGHHRLAWMKFHGGRTAEVIVVMKQIGQIPDSARP